MKTQQQAPKEAFPKTILRIRSEDFGNDSEAIAAKSRKEAKNMIRTKDTLKTEYREHMRDGNGTVELTSLIESPAELCDKGRLFSHITLKSGCSIGFHVHETDSELFYILSGTAQYNDNGEIKTVTAGDVTICPPGTGHGIANESEETVEFIAVIVYA